MYEGTCVERRAKFTYYAWCGTIESAHELCKMFKDLSPELDFYFAIFSEKPPDDEGEVFDIESYLFPDRVTTLGAYLSLYYKGSKKLYLSISRHDYLIKPYPSANCLEVVTLDEFCKKYEE